MSMNNMGVGITINGKDNSGAVVKKAESNFSGLFNTIKKGWQNSSLALGAMGYKAAQFGSKINSTFKAAAERSATFERSLSFVQARTGATALEMQKYRDQLLGKEFEGRNIDTAAAVFQTLSEETGNAADSMLILKSAMNLARVANLGETESAGMLQDVMGEFNFKAGQSAMVTDKMTWAMKTFGIVGNELQPMLFGVASGAQLAKASFDDTLLTLGMMKDVIPNASRAAMAANMAMMQLANPDVRKELKRQGVAVVDQQGKTRALVDIIGDLTEATKGMTEAERSKSLASIFSARSSGGLSIIVDKLTKGVTTAEGATLRGADAIRYYKEQMNAAGGATASAAKTITNDYAGALARAENAQKRFTQSVGAVTAELRRPFVETGAKAVNALVDAFRGMPPDAQKMMVGFAVSFGALASVLGKVLIASAAMKMFGVGILDLVFSVAKFALIVGPLTVLLGGFAVGLYTLFRTVQRNAGGVGDSFSEMGRKIKLGWSAAVEVISQGKLSDAMAKELRKSENSGVLKFVLMVDRLRVRLGAFFDGFSTGFKRALDELGPQANELLGNFKWIADIFTGEAFKDPLGNWVNSGEEAGYAMKDFATGALKTLGDLAGTLGGVLDSMKGISGKDIADGIRSLASAFSTLHSIGSGIGTVFGVVYEVFSRIANVFSLMGESLGNFIDALGAIKDTYIGRTIAGLFVSANKMSTEGAFDYTGASMTGGGEKTFVKAGFTARKVEGAFEKANIESDFKGIIPKEKSLRGLINAGVATEGEKKEYIEMRVELQKMVKRLENLNLTATVSDEALFRLSTRKNASEAERELVPEGA
jgi:TP901 family phage tail tape measure protein